jgi:hypothetical protein
MSDAELAVDDKPLSPIQIFCVKVIIVTAAALAMFYVADLVIESSIRRQAESLQILQGGPAFWRNAERNLFLLADEPDISPEKKKKILNALRKLSSKYKPYFDALNGNVPPGEPNPH